MRYEAVSESQLSFAVFILNPQNHFLQHITAIKINIKSWNGVRTVHFWNSMYLAKKQLEEMNNKIKQLITN